MSAPTRPTLLVAVAIVAMLMLRILHMLELEAGSILFTHPTVDALEYWSEARARAAGAYEYAVPMHGPLFPSLLGIAYAIFAGDAFWLHASVASVGVLTTLVLYLGGRTIVGAWPAALSALLFALYRPGLLYECEYYAAGLANFFVVCVGLLLAHTTHGVTWGRVLAVAVAIGMAVITRTNLAVLLPVAWLIFWRAKAQWSQLGVLTLVALLPASIYTVRNFALEGSWIFVQARGGQNLYMANHAEATGLVDVRPGPEFEAVRRRPMVEEEAFGLAEQDRFHRDRFVEFLSESPGAFAGLVARKAWHSLSPVEAPSAFDNELQSQFSWVLRLPLPGFGWFLPLALVGLWVGRRVRGIGGGVLGVAVAVWLTMLLIFPTGRYRYQLAGVFCLFAGLGLHGLWRVVWPLSLAVLRTRELYVALVGLVLAMSAPRFEAHYKAWQAEFDMLQAQAWMTKLQPKQGDLQVAREWARRAVRSDPDYAWPRFLLGAMATQSGAAREAIAHYDKAIELLPNFPEAHENRGYLLMRLERPEEAIASLRKAVEWMPFRHQSWRFLAQIYKSQGQIAEAKRCEAQARTAFERLRTMPWAR